MAPLLLYGGLALVGLYVWKKRNPGGAQSFPVAAQTPATTRDLGSSGPGQQNNSGYNPSGFFAPPEAPQSMAPANRYMPISAPVEYQYTSPVPMEQLPYTQVVIEDPTARFPQEVIATKPSAPQVAASVPKALPVTAQPVMRVDALAY